MRIIKASAFSLVTLIAACANDDPTRALGGVNSVTRIEYTDCWMPIPDYENITCGYLQVPEKRVPENTNIIKVAFAIIESTNDAPKAPIMYLDGGPGSAPIDKIVHWSNVSEPFRAEHDFILIDQRGTGYSQPNSDCDFNFFVESFVKRDLSISEIMRPCREGLISKGVTLSAYNNDENASDVNDLRKALEYEKVNLYGISYGTELALTVMRNHPQGIRSVILDSVVPLQVNVYEESAKNASQAFSTFFLSCKQQKRCNDTFPDLQNKFYALVEKLNNSPAEFELRIKDNEFTLVVDGSAVIHTLFLALYNKSNLPVIPFIIDTAHEDINLLASSIQKLLPEQLINRISSSNGMHYSIVCHDKIPFNRRDIYLKESEKYPPFGNLINFAEMQDFCDMWQSGIALERSHDPVKSDIPTLIFSGEFDPITPPDWGQLVANSLTNSYFYELRSESHGVIQFNKCGKQMAVDFLSNPLIEPDHQCLDDLSPIYFLTDRELFNTFF